MESKGYSPSGFVLAGPRASDIVRTYGGEPKNRSEHKRIAARRMPTEVNPEGDHNPKCDSQLLEGDETASHLRGRDFRVVQGYGHTQRPDSKTGNKTTSIDRRGAKRCALNDDTNAENDYSCSRSPEKEPISSLSMVGCGLINLPKTMVYFRDNLSAR